MAKSFKVSVNGEFDYHFSEEEIQSLDSLSLGTKKYHLLHNHTSFSAEITGSDFNKRIYEVQIKSNLYRVNISNELDQLISDMGLSAVVSKGINDIKAPMPGMILEVSAKEGDQVAEGDYLLVLEAMKMENTMTAPRDGVVKSVHVNKGETVDKGQLLIEME